MPYRLFLSVSAMVCGMSLPALAQTTKPLKHGPPNGAGIVFQLTDGTVLTQANNDSDWYKLTPDINGSYQNGTWSKMASFASNYQPYAFSSAVLADGRLVVAGGEYNFGQFVLTDICAIYDPVANTWTEFNAPPNWNYIGDSPSAVLPNGNFLLGRKLNKLVAALNPATLTWTAMRHGGKSDFNAEEGWTLLPNGTILTYDVKNAPNSENYDPVKQVWTSLGSTVSYLRSPPAEGPIKYPGGVYHPPGEVGPGILRPDGTVFATGSQPTGQNYGETAIWTPNGKGGGTWAAGPNFPAGDNAGDSFAVLVPDGNVLVEGANTGNLYEFNGKTLTNTKINGSFGSLMVLPTGEILVNGNLLYTEPGTPNPAWAPTISTAPSAVTRGSTYPISGTQFNGLSQAAAFGDELQTATNYPLVRITNTASGHVFYARTHDHSTMGVATGATIVSTNFDVPSAAETGASTLVVVANGIPSAPVTVTVQ
jgi:hypothetical protein